MTEQRPVPDWDAIGRSMGQAMARASEAGRRAGEEFGRTFGEMLVAYGRRGSASGGEITGPARTDAAVPYVLSRGHVQVSRAAWDAMGHDTAARLNACDDGSFGRPIRPDVTVVEPDGTLTEIEGSGP